jgi:outer membrane cobalamin receptor
VGANAVNGVINIITKSAKDTQGLYAEAGGGSQPQDFTGVRYGGSLNPIRRFESTASISTEARRCWPTVTRDQIPGARVEEAFAWIRNLLYTIG